MEYVNFDYLTNDMLNLSIVLLDFCKKNNISLEDISKISASKDTKNMYTKKVNPIIDWFGIKDKNDSVTEDVYVRDIIGWEPSKDKGTLLDILSDCYADSTETYRIRDNEKLELSKDKMLQNMVYSFDYEPICVNEIEGKKVVSTNGCHRTSILKFLYLVDLEKGELPPEELDEKYKIKANVDRYDIELTYMHYLLKQMDVVSYIGIKYDSSWKPSGYYKVDTKDSSKTMSKEEITTLFNESLDIYGDRLNSYSINSNLDIPSFKDFIMNYAPTLIKEDQYGSLS